MNLALLAPAAVACGAVSAALLASDVVPSEIQQPGTQPDEVGQLETTDKCDNCHGGYDPLVEPAHNWFGSMMANAGRDPLFWATLAVAEQDFDGAGDLCIRCHSPAGWVDGRSTPTNGSALASKDADGVQCDLCHALTNPDGSEHVGVQFPPFIANDGSEPYFGSGMYVLWPTSAKLGPYLDAEARHQFLQSQFHRDANFCGTCHDVSNPAVGDLAHNAGTQLTGDPDEVVRSGVFGSSVDGKAAFNNLPYRYGVVERTFSEYVSGLLDETRVDEYFNLPEELQDGAIAFAYESALAAETGGNYADGSTRYFTCQTCHMPPVVGAGCDKNGAPIRKDLPLHDMTGGNYWIADAILHQDSQGQLRLGGGLTAVQTAALADGQQRARDQLSRAAALKVDGNVLRVINLTGHKLITGYPEGRRMWLNVKWYDADGTLLREDGEYGQLAVTGEGLPAVVETLLDPADPNTRIYEAHHGMTQEWAGQLLDLSYPADLALTYDRVTGEVSFTLGDLAGSAPGSHVETFHFVLNNLVIQDNRIPPYGMDYDTARIRNALPVPPQQYGDPGPGGAYDHWDEVPLDPPSHAEYATIELKYQPTSWEYIQFLYLANDGQDPFLADEGVNLLNAWLATGMAAPHVMVATTWGTAPEPPVQHSYVDELSTWCVHNNGTIAGPCDTFQARDNVGILAHVVDEAGLPIAGAEVLIAIVNGTEQLAVRTGVTDEAGQVVVTWKVPRNHPPGPHAAELVDVVHDDYTFDGSGSVTSVTFQVQ